MNRLLTLTSVVLLVNVSCGTNSNSSDANAPAAVSPPTPTANADIVNPNSETLGSGEVTDGNAEPITTDGVSENPATPVAPASAVTFEIDATVKDLFTYLDLDRGKIVAESDASWDLAFKKTVIKMNGESVKAAVIKDATFEDVLMAPEAVLVSDTPVVGGKETDGLVFHSTDSWYAYDMVSHTVSSKGYVYVIKTNAGTHFKFSIVDYYNVDRLPGFHQVKWQQLSVAQVALTAGG